MQTSGSESIDSAVPLFDVIISMPPDAKLETVQRLAETQAGLPPQRVERLIQVLRSTPNAKVGTGVVLERAEEEKARFLRAGLRVEITPHLPAQTSAQGGAAPNPDDTSDPAIALIRAQVRAELAKEYSIKKSSFLMGKGGLVAGATLAVAVGLLYTGQNGISVGGVSLPWGNKNSPLTAATTPQPYQASSGLSGAGSGAAIASTEIDLAGDADVDDPLIQAARALAAAGGNGGAAAGKGADAVPKQTRQIMTAEFASLLAELGQGARAREVLKALAGGINPATDKQAESALEAAGLKLQAWSALRMDGGQARQVADDLRVKTQAIANPQERTLLQGQVAAILSRNTLLPPEIPRLFLSLGAESLKAVGSAQSGAALGDLAVSTAEVFLHETTARAKAGGWSKARASAAQIDDLLKQALDAWAQTRLYAVDYQAKLQIGQTDKATKSLESALGLAGKNSNLQERAIWLRSIAQLSADASTHEQFEAMATALQNQFNAKTGMEKARGLTELTLLYTAAGLPGKASQLRSQAQATAGLSAADSVTINTDLLVRSDMSTAKMLHGLGRYAEAEAVLQRVSGYLF